MTIETVLGYVLSAALGCMTALFWAYSKHGDRLTKLEGQMGKANLEVLANEIAALQASMAAMGLLNLAADVKSMRGSIIFRPEFQEKLAVVCSEHQNMHDQIGFNTEKLKVFESLLNIKQ